MSNVDARIGRLLDFIYKSEIEKLNDHLPRELKSLKDIASNSLYTLKARDGSNIIIDRNEVSMLCNLLPSDLHDKLMLPLIFLRRIDLGRGAYELLGGKVEAFTVLKILGYNVSLEEVTLPLRLYKPQIFKLKMMLSTLVMIAFSTFNEDDTI